MKNKNAFTFIELLGVIVILAIIALIAFPTIINLLGSKEEVKNEGIQNLLIAAAGQYVNDHVNDFPKQLTNKTEIKSYGETGNLTADFLIKNGYISTTEINEKKNCKFLNDYIKVTSNSKKYFYEYTEVKEGDCKWKKDLH